MEAATNIVVSSSSAGPKRLRSTLSCVQCRQAKARCDRQSPCALCVRKNRAEQCTYPLPVSRKKAAVSLQKRLMNLESMIKDVMTNNEKATGITPPQDMSFQPLASTLPTSFDADTSTPLSVQLSFDPGDINPASQGIIEGNGSSYIGNTHWKTLLENVSILPYAMSLTNMP